MGQLRNLVVPPLPAEVELRKRPRYTSRSRRPARRHSMHRRVRCGGFSGSNPGLDSAANRGATYALRSVKRGDRTTGRRPAGTYGLGLSGRQPYSASGPLAGVAAPGRDTYAMQRRRGTGARRAETASPTLRRGVRARRSSTLRVETTVAPRGAGRIGRRRPWPPRSGAHRPRTVRPTRATALRSAGLPLLREHGGGY